jgi:hypothetical protein
LARECRKRQPTLQILILTGSPVITDIEEAQFPCLRKPLENLEDLDQAVGRMVSAAQKDRAAGGEP